VTACQDGWTWGDRLRGLCATAAEAGACWRGWLGSLSFAWAASEPTASGRRTLSIRRRQGHTSRRGWRSRCPPGQGAAVRDCAQPPGLPRRQAEDPPLIVPSAQNMGAQMGARPAPHGSALLRPAHACTPLNSVNDGPCRSWFRFCIPGGSRGRRFPTPAGAVLGSGASALRARQHRCPILGAGWERRGSVRRRQTRLA
jgi:hypothetical protein